MSKAHHNDLYYRWWAQTHPTCLLCGLRGEQFHHFQLIGGTRYSGPIPRRHSTYNAALLCAVCHARIHEQGEAEVVKLVLGSEKRLYQLMMRRHHEFMDWLTERVLRGDYKG